jgi:branched-chain amino acid transport system permease protein
VTSRSLRLRTRGFAAGASRRGTRRSPALDVALLLPLIAVAVFIGITGSGYHLQLATDIAMYVALTYAWNMISGFTGYISLGQVAFFGVGSYVTALLIIHANFAWWLACLAAGVVLAVAAIPLGAVMLRLKGIYFALGTFGLVRLAQIAAENWNYVGGTTGLPLPAVLAKQNVFAFMVALAVVGFLVNLYIARSPFGLRAMAIRDDEDAAKAMGVFTTRTKVAAYAASAVLPAIAGGLVAWNRSFVDPNSAFDASLDLQIILFALAGGIGTVWGPMIGAIGLSLIGEQLWARYNDLQQGLFGALIVACVLILPGGVVSLLNRVGLFRRPVVHAPRELPEAEGAVEPAHPIPAGQPVIECRNVSMAFGGVRAVDGVDLRVDAGQSVFIIGANGAGKTTLFNTVTGFLKPTTGEVLFRGERVAGRSIARLARGGIGRTFQIPRLFDSLTVWENVLLPSLSVHKGRDAVEHSARVLRTLTLDRLWLEPTASLPVGHRRQVELARALALSPNVVLLDEVMAGMSHEEVEGVREIVRTLQGFGISAVAGVEHVIHAIVDLADEIVVLDRGRVIARGPAADVLRDPAVVEAYLGEELVAP